MAPILVTPDRETLAWLCKIFFSCGASMRLSILVATLVLALGCTLNATSQTFPIDDEHQFPTSVMDLPAQRQRAILNGLTPSLARIAIEDELNRAEVAEMEKELLVREISDVAGKLLIVQGLGPVLCGNAAGGNCTFWVSDDHNHLLLAGGSASELTILKSSHRGRRSIVASLNTSGGESNVIWYRFDGTRYLPSACAIKSYFRSAFGDDPNAPPQIEYRPCSKVIGKYVW